MISYFRFLARATSALTLLACASENSPTAPAADSAEALSPSASISASRPSPEELAAMPSGFLTSPTISNAWVDVGFHRDGAYASAYMQYWATNAEQDVTLILRFENSEVASKTNRTAQANFLPWSRSLNTTATFGVNGTCGHLADGHSAHRAWHQFLVDWKFFRWGDAEVSRNDGDMQPSCPKPDPDRAPGKTESGGGGGGEGGDGGYDDECGWVCQQWLYFENGVFLYDDWECDTLKGAACAAY